MATKIRTSSAFCFLFFVPMKIATVRPYRKSVLQIRSHYTLSSLCAFFFCFNVSCSFQTTEHPESFFFRPNIVQLDRKNEILSCISKSFSIVVPVILSFLFSWLISFHSLFQAIRAVAFFFFVLACYSIRMSYLCLLVSDPKVLSNICLLMVRKNDNDHSAAGSMETLQKKWYH